MAGLTEIIRFALERVFDEERIAVFRERLRERLSTGQSAARATLQKKYERLIRTQKRVLQLAIKTSEPEPLLDAEFKSISTQLREIEQQLKSCEISQSQCNRQDIAQQIEVDPKMLADRLLDGKLSVGNVRTVLVQLFPRFVFLGRESRTIARFEIDFAPGAAVAWLTETKTVLDEAIRLRVKLIGSARRPVVWQVVEESVSSLD